MKGSGYRQKSGPRTARLPHDIRRASHSQEEPGGPPPAIAHNRAAGQSSSKFGDTRATHSDALVLFGVTGDLAHKKIFPALYALAKHGALKVPVIGVAFEKW